MNNLFGNVLVVAQFKAMCLHVFSVSEENHEGLQDSMSPSLDWRQQPLSCGRAV